MLKLNSFNTPVLVVFFNRPDTLEKVLKKVKEVAPSRLYLAQDGARLNNLEDIKNIQACQEVVRSIIDWDCEIKTSYKDKNFGCKKAVSGAISWFFEHEEMGIILEDDCLPDESFFSYCSHMLEYYKDNHEIGMICGSNLTNHACTKVSEDIYFSRMPLVWGWASWKRVWKNYDVSIKDWPTKKEQILYFNQERSFRINWISIFNRIYLNKIDSWDYQFNYLLWKEKQLCVVPKENLIKNIGFDERATHTLNQPEHIKNQSLGKLPKSEQWNLPSSIIVNTERDKVFLKEQQDPGVSILKNSIQSFLVKCLDKVRGLN